MLILRTAVLPLREPKLLGGVIHHPLIEDPVVIDDAAEAIGPVPLDPVHHEAAIGGAERTCAIAVEPVVSRHGGIQTFAQVDQRLAAPVAADRVREGLPVAW